MKKVNWEQMTGGELVKAVKTTGGVCLVPIGCLEKHAEHLPVGTDVLVASAIATAAARIEPAVVFPVQHLAVTNELKCWPGVIATPTHLLIRMWENLCDEIARNGFRKIVLVNYHGGNRFLLGQFVIELMDRPRDYAVYWPRNLDDPVLRKKLMKSRYEAHAGELETSAVMHLHPDLVRQDMIGALDGRPQRDFDLGGDVYTSADWYSLHPDHYGGDAHGADAEKGKLHFESMVAKLARIVRRIRKDRRVPELLAEYYRRAATLPQSGKPPKANKGKRRK